MSQARKGTTRRRRMRCDERLVVVRRDSPRQWGSKTMARAESGGGWIPKRERELQQGRHRAMSRGKKGQRIAPVLPRRSGGGGGGGRVVGEKEKVQKFGWGRGREMERGAQRMERPSEKTPRLLGRSTAAARERRERREEPAGTHSAISGTGPREVERGKRPRGRVGTQHCARTAIG